MDMLDLFFKAGDGLTLTEVSNQLTIPKSSAHGILQAMHRRGYLALDPQTKRYSIGLRLLALAQAAPVLRTIQRCAGPYLELLAAKLEETAILCGYDVAGGEVTGIICIDHVESPSPIRYVVEVGTRWPLHCSTVGKLYLATLPDEKVVELLTRLGLERFTERTPASVDQVLRDLREVRKNGYAVNRGEIIDGVTGYGAPIRVTGDVLVGGMAVVGPTERMQSKEAQIVGELTAAARALSAELDGQALS